MVLTKNDKKCMLVLFAAMLLLTGIPALMLHVNTTVDEMGTLASAALLTGRNWHIGLVSAGGFYYKYGQAFLWVIPCLIIEDTVVLYKVVSFINALFMSFTPVIAYYISRRYLKIEKEISAALLAAAAAFIGDVMFQSLYLRGDNMLIVLNWACALMLLNALNAESERKRILYSVLLSFFAVYAYACHSRGIVAVIAVTMTVFIIQFFGKKKYIRYIPFLGSMAVFLVIDKLLQSFFKNAIWGERAGHATGISKESIRLLFTVSGIKTYIKMAVGWLFNSFTPTMGLACVGILVCLIMVVFVIRKSDKISKEEGILAVFGILSYAGSFALGTIFFEEHVHKNFVGKASQRIDRIVYDRYVCCAFGVLCLMAIYVLVWRKDIFGIRSRIASIGVYGAVLAVFAVITAPWLNNQSFVRKYMGILCTFLEQKSGLTINSPNASQGIVLLGVVIFVVFLVLMILSMRKKVWPICTIVLTCSVLLYGYNVNHITLAEDESRIKRINTALTFVNSLGDLHEEYPVIWNDATAAPVKTYQLMLRDYDLMTSKYQAFEDTDNMLVIAKKLPSKDSMSEGSYYTFDDINYKKERKDIVYVKGNELKEELESRGFSMTAFYGK